MRRPNEPIHKPVRSKLMKLPLSLEVYPPYSPRDEGGGGGGGGGSGSGSGSGWWVVGGGGVGGGCGVGGGGGDMGGDCELVAVCGVALTKPTKDSVVVPSFLHRQNARRMCCAAWTCGR